MDLVPDCRILLQLPTLGEGHVLCNAWYSSEESLCEMCILMKTLCDL